MRKIFLAGVIQGSKRDDSICPQDYRGRIIDLVRQVSPETEIYNPLDGHEHSISYDDDKGKAVFFEAIDKIGECDLMIAYLPEASLGTAIEMWECHRLNIPVWTLTPMAKNWVVRFFSERVFADVESFAAYYRNSRATTFKEN